MINKKKLVEILWGALNEDPDCVEARTKASQQKDLYWSSDEWIWVKDLEVILKQLKKELEKNNLLRDIDLPEILTGNSSSIDYKGDSYVTNLFDDAKESLNNISNPT